MVRHLSKNDICTGNAFSFEQDISQAEQSRSKVRSFIEYLAPLCLCGAKVHLVELPNCQVMSSLEAINTEIDAHEMTVRLFLQNTCVGVRRVTELPGFMLQHRLSE